MTPSERFVWISIYLECWPNRALPADSADLAKYLGYTVEEIKAGLTDRVLTFFRKVEGELISPELEEYRATLELRNLKKSEGGKEGAKRKREKAPGGLGNAEGTPRGKPVGSLEQSKPNQSSQTQSSGKGDIHVDSWVGEYEKASRGC